MLSFSSNFYWITVIVGCLKFNFPVFLVSSTPCMCGFLTTVFSFNFLLCQIILIHVLNQIILIRVLNELDSGEILERLKFWKTEL